MMALFGCAMAGLYLWQPLRLDLAPFDPEQSADGAGFDASRLFRRGTRVVIVTAHPDDTEFYIGGTLLRLADVGAEVTLLVATDGDKGYYPLGTPSALAQIRRAEQTKAAAVWKAQKVLYLGGPDGRLRQTDALVARLTAEFRRLRPEFVIALDGAYPPRFSHRDHHVSGRATESAARRSGFPLWLLRTSTRVPNYVHNVTDLWEKRLALLPLHRSQFRGRRLQAVRGIITRNAERDGRLLSVCYAEGFRCTPLARAAQP